MTVERVIAPRRRSIGAAEVDRLLPFHARRMVGPFIFADLIGPEDLAPGRGADVPPHPHIGLATVTYLFDGTLVHRDSTGAVQAIEPGGVNWMTAGSRRRPLRALARRRPRRSTPTLAGLQTWVALPDEAEEVDAVVPARRRRPSCRRSATAASSVRLLVGTAFGAASPVPGRVAAVPRRRPPRRRHPVRPAARARRAGRARGRRRRRGRRRAGPAAPPRRRRPTATPSCGRRRAARVMTFGGAPVGQRYIWWNFVSSSQERIEAAKADWAARRFAPVPGETERVELPGDSVALSDRARSAGTSVVRSSAAPGSESGGGAGRRRRRGWRGLEQLVDRGRHAVEAAEQHDLAVQVVDLDGQAAGQALPRRRRPAGAARRSGRCAGCRRAGPGPPPR